MAREWVDLIAKLHAAPDIETAIEIVLHDLLTDFYSAVGRDAKKADAQAIQLGEDIPELVSAILDHKEVFKPLPAPPRRESAAAPHQAVRPVAPPEAPPAVEPPREKHVWSGGLGSKKAEVKPVEKPVEKPVDKSKSWHLKKD